MILTGKIGFLDGQIVERFDCYKGTSALEKLSQDLLPQGVNFIARKAQVGVSSAFMKSYSGT